MKRTLRNSYSSLLIVFALVNLLLPGARAVAVPGGANGFSSSAHSHFASEQGRLEQFNIPSPQLQVGEHTIQVYLPPDYDSSGRSYPVMYMNDGSDLFTNDQDLDWHLEQTLDKLFANGALPGVIVVGIYPTDNRWDEYSPWYNTNMKAWNGWHADYTEGGEGDAYLAFIIDTLKPEIDQRFRTLPDRENTAIGGASMGAIISLYAGLSHSEVFSKVMAMSPAVWFAEADGTWLSNNQLINYILYVNAPKDVTYYLDVGSREWEDRLDPIIDGQGRSISYSSVYIDGAMKVALALEEADVPHDNINFVMDMGGVHDPTSWGMRFEGAVLWLFTGSSTYQQPTPEPTLTPTVTPIPPTATLPAATPSMIPEPAADDTPAQGSGKWILVATALLLIAISAFIAIRLARRRAAAGK